MPRLANLLHAAPHRPAVLIVDDAPDHIAVVHAMMATQGYQTYIATSGVRAVEIAQRVKPDLVLLDIVMPGIDGLEVCRRLKADAATASIPVIFMSERNDADDIVAGFDLGAVDYIPKPLRAQEVCARVRTQLRLSSGNDTQRALAEHLRMIVDSMDQILLILDGAGRIQYANPASERYLGQAPQDLAGRALAQLLEDDDPGCGQRASGVREVRIRQRDGTLRAMELNLAPMPAADGLSVALLHDITHHKQSEDALQRAALFDPLTKIANRRHFDSLLEKEWQRATRKVQFLSLVMLDVDHFKLYNDTLGHAAGDACLRKVAQVLQAHSLRPTDLAARYGGEEFVLLYAETPATQAVRLAESVRAAIEGLQLPHPSSPTSPWVTVSVGVATVVPTMSEHIEDLFVAADRAMYAAKADGRNRVRKLAIGRVAEACQAHLLDPAPAPVSAPVPDAVVVPEPAFSAADPWPLLVANGVGSR
jgi:diguanylate cyclase (GGDEF)-like protein/PAS domain S-box-containing protein